MNVIFKKTVAVFMTVLTFVSMIPVSAFAADSSKAESQQQVEYSSTNAIGNMILESSDISDNFNDESYRICSVEMSGTVAVARVSVKEKCELVVGIYSEDGKLLLASGKEQVDITEGSSVTEVIVDISTDKMPEYFFLKAFLLDDNLEPLCEHYENIEYTKAFEEFYAKTTADFEEERVINLDESESENFLVVTDEAKIVEKSEDENQNVVITDDFQNNFYVIENATDEIKKLKEGEVLYYEYGDGNDEYIITKVESIRIEGNTVEIKGTAPENLTDFFQYAKIDMDDSESTFEQGNMDSAVSHESEELLPRTRDININSKREVKHKWAATLPVSKNGKLSFGVQTVFSFSFRLYIDFYIFGVKYAFTEVLLGIDSDVKVALTGGGLVKEIPLGVIGFQTGIGVTAAILVNLVVDVEAEITLSFKLVESQVGFFLDGNGFKNKTRINVQQFTPELNSDLKIFVGLEVSPVLKAGKYMTAQLKGRVGAEAVITKNKEDRKQFDAYGDEKIEGRHRCDLCLDIALGIRVDLSLKVKFLKYVDRSYKFVDIFIKVGDFYFAEPFDGGWFGIGECPRYDFPVKVIVKDSVGNPVANAVVDEMSVTDAKGEAIAYVPDGGGSVSVVSPLNQKASEVIDFSLDAPIPVAEIVLNNASGISGEGSVGENISWRVYKDGELVIKGIGEMPDYTYADEAPWKAYKDAVKRISVSEGITVVGEYAFDDFTAVKEIALPSSLTEVRANAFECTSITNDTEINSKEDFDRIEAELKNEDFLNVRIPENLEVIDTDAFVNSAISFFTVEEDNKFYSNDDRGVLFNKDKTCLIRYPNSNLSDKYTIPLTVTKIDDNAFSMAVFIDTVVIHDAVTGNANFLLCIDLSKVIIGKSITGFGAVACMSLEKVNIPSNVKKVVCTYSGIKSIKIPRGVTEIPDYAFMGCDNLEEVYLPSSITYIGESAFDAPNLEAVYYEGDEQAWMAIDSPYGTNGLNIFYNVYPPDEFEIWIPANRDPVDDGNDDSSVMNYVFVVVKEETAEDLISPENLIYIDQKESSDGYPDFDWTLPEGVDKYYTMHFLRNLEQVNHKHSYDEGTKTAPTCTQEGYTTYTCSCGESYNSDYVDMLEHSFIKQIVEDEYIKTGATCASPAEYFYACEDCSSKGDKTYFYGEALKLGRPSAVSATQTADTVTLTWSAVPEATGYRVYVRENNKWVNLNKTTTETSCIVSELTAGTKYTFAVRAYIDTDDKIIWSPTFRTVITATQPALISKVTSSKQTADSITVTWSEVNCSGYRVFRYNPTTKKWEIAVRATRATSAKITGLTQGRNYIFAVRPYVNTGKQIIWSKTYTKITTSTKLAQVTLKVHSSASNRATVVWGKASGATGYQVWYSTSPTSGYRKVANYASNSTYQYNLKSGTTYYYRARAYKAVGGSYVYGAWSPTVSVKIR